MAPRMQPPRPDESKNRIRRAFRYAFYDWTREMPALKRFLAWTGILLQGYAVYCIWARSLVWPMMWPHGAALYVSAWLIYVLGAGLMNGMLTSEFVRKTQLEADQIAARQIQQTLIPSQMDELPGYEVEMFYEPFREVGGDYFDVIDLPGNRTLFALADVSGKGMPAALLAASIQALLRSGADSEADPLLLARQINRHLSRYSPRDRYATAVFIVLHRDSGELTYVNAGHNAPILTGPEEPMELVATGVPLGLFSEAPYEARAARLSPGGALLLFTDGLTDSISGDNAEDRLRDALADRSEKTMTILKSLVNPSLREDDVTILLVTRSG